MTAQPMGTDAIGAIPIGARDDWLTHLEDMLDPEWRRGEWDPVTSVFVGDPSNVMTKVYRCPLAGCIGATEGKERLCPPCAKALKRSGESREVWEAHYRPPWRREFSLAPDAVNAVDLPRHVKHVAGTLGRNQFSLAKLNPALRGEILLGLQHRDHDRIILAPSVVRRLVRLLPAGLPSVLHLEQGFDTTVPTVVAGMLRRIVVEVQRVDGLHRHVDFTEGDVWSPALIGLTAAPNRRYLAAFGSIDFRTIRQPWLRELSKEYARAVRPSASELHRVLAAIAIASDALASRVHGDEPTLLNMADMTAIVEAYRDSTHPDGTQHSQSHRISLLGWWRRTLDFCRSAGLMDTIPGTFTVNPRYHVIRRHQMAEDVLGRAIPEHVIAQLDEHLDLLKRGSGYEAGGWTSDDYGEMYVVVYKLLRDTGRRLNEIVSLKRHYLEWVDGKPTLVWDNHKRARMGRRLPIDASTAEIITTWLARRDRLTPTPGAEEWMFPAPGPYNRQRSGHVKSAHFCSHSFKKWIDSIPVLYDIGLNPDGTPRVLKRTGLTTYGLRHAYAQRHADNGTPVDTLRQLMDHRSVETTMGYYVVNLNRKRQAIEAVAALAIDRHGRPSPSSDPLSYQRDAVSVPFGNCTEPTNVKAGGKHCPIRYQCAGCNFYRPDPSYLAAIERHITSLTADRELAAATDTAGWVMDNLQHQIDAFTTVATTMRDTLASLTAEHRDDVEQAITVLQRDRGSHTVLIPITSLTQGLDR